MPCLHNDVFVEGSKEVPSIIIAQYGHCRLCSEKLVFVGKNRTPMTMTEYVKKFTEVLKKEDLLVWG